jgi:GAF domain-containing protein
MDYEQAAQHVKELIKQSEPSTMVQKVVDFLYDHFERYSWVGIYLVEGRELVLGPWKGPHATEHTRIPIGKGVCGAAAKSGTTEIVDDVSKDTRYLACFISTRSEIVVPITKDSTIVGEIDIDSNVSSAFSKEDTIFLEKVADMLSQHI